MTQASFYIAWSEEYEKQGNCRKADLVYQEGFKKCAEPHDKLLQFHKYGDDAGKFEIKFSKILNISIITIFRVVIHRALQARVSRQVMMNVEEDDSDDEPKEPERVSLAVLRHRGKKKAIAPINRTGPAIRSKHMNLKLKAVLKF